MRDKTKWLRCKCGNKIGFLDWVFREDCEDCVFNNREKICPSYKGEKKMAKKKGKESLWDSGDEKY